AFASNDELGEYLHSDDFIFMPDAQKMQALFEKLKEFNIIQGQEFNESFNSYLRAKLTEQIFADDEFVASIQKEELFGKKAIGWLKRQRISQTDLDQVQKAIDQILLTDDFRKALSKDGQVTPLRVLQIAIENNIFLGTPSLRSFTEALRKALPEQDALKINKTRLMISDYVAFVAGLEHPKIKKFLSGDFRFVKEPYRMFMLLRELQRLGICFSSESMDGFYLELPAVSADNADTRSIFNYFLNISEVVTIKNIFTPKFLALLLADKSFRGLSEEGKVDKMYELLKERESLSDSIARADQKVKAFLRDILNNFQSEGETILRLRKKVFKDGVENFLTRHPPVKNKNNYHLLEQAVKAFHEDTGSWEKIRSGSVDFPTALVQFAIEKNINLGTNYLLTFVKYYRGRKEFSADLENVPITLDVSFKDFINLRAYLIHPAVEQFINEDLRRWPPWERLVALLESMEKRGLVLEKDDLGVVTGVLPDMLTSEFSKAELRSMSFLRLEYYQIKKDFDQVKRFLQKEDIRESSMEKKIDVIWQQAKKKRLFLGERNMSRALKYLLTCLIQDFEIDDADMIFKEKREELFGANVNNWMKRHHEYSIGVPRREAMTAAQFWADFKADASFRAALEDDTKSIQLQVVCHAIQMDYDLGTPSLGDFFGRLKSEMPGDIPEKIRKRFHIVAGITVNDFINFYSGLFHPQIQELLKSPQFLTEVPRHIRLVYLWEYMKRLGLPVPTVRFRILLPVLPPNLPGGRITRNDFGPIDLNMVSVEAIREAVLRFKDVILSDDFRALSPKAKVDVFLGKVKEEKVSLGFDLKSERPLRFLEKLLMSAADDGIDKALGLKKIDVVSEKVFLNGMNNGNGVPAEQHVVTFSPADFLKPLVNEKGSLIVEEASTIDPKSARKKI
ncbi:MAG: hypothetical protein NT079_02095, partial [Candidatus Omnitrophica bacterium]|nr:hypothetical protein [Candidatus Omnitrophota bacterium]